MRFSGLFLFAFVCCESIQHLQTLVLWVMVIKELSHLGFQQLSSLTFIGYLTRRSSRRNELGAKFMASIGFVFNNKLFRMNLFRFVYIENIQRGSLAPVR